MATVVNFGLQQYSTLDPRTIATCSLWLDATDSSTLTLSGTSVTTWKDKSGNSRNATGGTSPTRTTNGVVFNGSSQYLATTYTAVPSAESVFVVATWTGTTTKSYSMIGSSAGNGRSYVVTRPSSGAVTVQWRRRGVAGYAATSGVVASTRFLSSAIFTGTGGTTGFNGGAQSTSAAFTFTGTGTTTIGVSATTEYFQGTINELVVYAAALTSAQRQQVEGYLAWKWGLRTSLPASHPYRYFPVLMRPFQPIDILNCAVWVDPADATTVLTKTGNQPTTLRSKGSQEITLDNTQPTNNAGPGTPWTAWPPPGATNYGTQFMTNSSSNLNTLQFTQTVGTGGVYGDGYNGSYLRIPSLTFTSQQRTLVFVRSAQDAGSGTFAHMFSPTVYSGLRQRGVLDYTKTSYTMFPVSTNGASQTLIAGGVTPYSGAETAGTPYIYAIRHTTTTGSNYTSINGTTLTPSTTQALTTGYLTGTSEYVIGIFFAYARQFLMGDFILYDGALQTSEMQQLEGYLAWKWGLRGSLPSTHLYSKAPPFTPLFVPTALASCALWLDTADTSTWSSAQFAPWTDKSGNGRTATPSSPNIPQSSGFTFNGIRDEFTTSYTDRPAAETVFAVVTWTGTDDGEYPILGTSTSGGRGYHVTQTAGTPSIRWHKNGTGGYASTGGIESGVKFLSSGVFTGTGGTTGVNGGAQSTSAAFTLTAGSATTSIGSGTAGYFKGTVYEIVVYSVALTESQRKRVEGYLAWKWGVQTSLPASHPYARFRP